MASVSFHPRRIIGDERGSVRHIFQNDPQLLESLGEVYASTIHVGQVKAWKRHSKASQNLVVLQGKVRIVTVTEGNEPEVQQFTLGPDEAYGLLHIPPMVWYGFVNVGDCESITINVTDYPHDPSESVNASLDAPELAPHRHLVEAP